MSTTDVGKDAEKLVAEYLKKNKHKIIDMNWRTRWCEIDIISKTKDCVFFTEVKFRSNDSWGDGLDYITAKKLKQMRFAAEIWLHDNNWQKDSVLQAAAVNIENEIEVLEIDDIYL
jgi:uncharacterized protein (TIGR00252 family)